MSRTHVDLDDALQELLRHEAQLKLRELKGKINWEGDLQKLRANRNFK